MTCSVAMDVSMALLCTAAASLGEGSDCEKRRKRDHSEYQNELAIRVEGYICGPEVSAKWDGRGNEAIATKERERETASIGINGPGGRTPYINTSILDLR